MNKIRVAIVGYGNVGAYALEAVQAAGDMEIAGIVRRSGGTDIGGIPVVTDVKELGAVDIALLCVPSRKVEETAQEYLVQGISTVDSFDIHSSIVEVRKTLGEAAVKGNAVAVVSAGWDPGSDSMVRALLEAAAPRGITYTNFGPGMSMGHSVAAKAVDGVEDALSMTIPTGTGIHRRVVYVQLKQGADFATVTQAIKEDAYFAKDETHVLAVERVSDYIDVGHGVNLTRKGVSGATHNQMFTFEMRINNPALTSQLMVSCARGAMRQKPGAYTMIELPVIDLLEGNREDIIHKLV